MTDLLSMDQLLGESSETPEPEPWDMPNSEIGKSERLRQEEAHVLTAAAYDGTEPAIDVYHANYARLGTSSFEELQEGIVGKFLQPELEAVNELVLDHPQEVTDYRNQRQAEVSSPMGVHQTAMENISQVDDYTTKIEILKSYAGYKLAEMLEATSIGEAFANYASEFFLPVNTKDRNDFLNKVYGGNAEVDFKTAIVQFSSLNPEERLAMFPAMQSFALEATDGNEVRASRLLSEMYSLSPSAAGWDVVYDLLALPVASAVGLAKAVKTHSFIKSVAKVNPGEASDLIISSAKVDEISEVTGITGRTAAESTVPFKWSDVSPDAIDGIEPTIVARLEEEMAQTAKAIREVDQANISRSAATEAEQKVAQQKALIQFEKESDKLRKKNGWSATNARVTKSDDTGFTIEYDLNADTVNNLTPKPVRVDYNRNDIGLYNKAESTGVGQYLQSPSVYANRSQKNVSELATAIGLSQEKMLHGLMDIANDAYKGLNKESVLKVDDVLIAGDEFKDTAGIVIGKVFTPHELMNEGITGVGRLSEKEATAYYKARTFWDGIHRMERDAVIKEWRFNNVQHVGSFANENIYGQIISKANLSGDVKRVVNLATKSIDDIGTVAEKEVQFVKLQRNIENGEDIFEYAIIPKNSARRISDFDPHVLPKKTGYVPLIRANSYYFVERQNERVVNGVSGKRVPQVVRSFNSKTDAERWAAQATQETGIPHAFKRDRDMAEGMVSDLQQSQFGKPIFGSRVTDRDILFGFDGDKPLRINAAAAMERNITSAAMMIPMNEFRMANMQRWHNSARPYLNKADDVNSGFKAGVNDKEVQHLVAMRTWLDDQNRIPTKSELQWQGMVRGAAEWMETKFPGTTYDRLHELSKVDPFGAARGMAFHSLLGWFNPAQILVQSMGATVAISLNPAKFPKIVGQYMALKASYKLSPEAQKVIATKLNMDPDKWVELMRGYNRAGIADSLKTTADYNAANLGYGMNAAAIHNSYMSPKGMVKRTFSTLADKGLIFYREGEQFNRSYAWLLAADDYMKLNNIKKLKDADIDAITTQSLKYTMNMNRANRAGWQKGYLSIPTQFWQVTAKFMENIMPEMLGGGTKAWTGRQKAQVLTGQLALFGAAGVPLGDSLYNAYLDFTETNPADVSAQEALTVKQGLMGVVSKYMTGGDIEVSERFAFGSGFNQLIETFFRGDKTFGEIASGAAGVFPERVIQAAAAIYPRISDPEYSLGDITAIGNELASLTSTWRNASKALLMNKVGEIRTSGGEVVDRFNPEHNMGVIWAQAAGFQPSALSEYYDLKNYNRAVAQLKTDVLKSLESNFRQYLTGDVGDPSWQQRYQKINETLVSALDPVDQDKVWKTWADRMNQDAQLTKLRDTALQNFINSGTRTPSTLNSYPNTGFE